MKRLVLLLPVFTIACDETTSSDDATAPSLQRQTVNDTNSKLDWATATQTWGQSNTP